MYTAMPTREVRQSALGDDGYDSLDDLLYEWFIWENGYNAVKGYGGADKSFMNVVSSRQHDSTIEILERQVVQYQMPVIQTCIQELSGDSRLAIRIEQSNRYGPSVYRNPRAGDDQPAAYAAAKREITPLLKRRGIVW